MVFLGTYSYGLYVYHHFISYYLVSNRTEWELARWLGSHGAAIALQATLGASASLALAYLSYELFEKRFLSLKRLFETAEDAAPHPSRLAPPSFLEGPAVVQGARPGTAPARFNNSSDRHKDSSDTKTSSDSGLLGHNTSRGERSAGRLA